MNWYDYTRGYDDGGEDFRTTRYNKGILLSLFQLVFAIIILFARLSFFFLKGLAGIVWSIIRIVAGRKL